MGTASATTTLLGLGFVLALVYLWIGVALLRVRRAPLLG